MFKFHSKCAELKLSHLCFIEEFIIFSSVDVKLVSIIQEVLEYIKLSGLKENPTKSEAFMAVVLTEKTNSGYSKF